MYHLYVATPVDVGRIQVTWTRVRKTQTAQH